MNNPIVFPHAGLCIEKISNHLEGSNLDYSELCRDLASFPDTAPSRGLFGELIGTDNCVKIAPKPMDVEIIFQVCTWSYRRHCRRRRTDRGTAHTYWSTHSSKHPQTLVISSTSTRLAMFAICTVWECRNNKIKSYSTFSKIGHCHHAVCVMYNVVLGYQGHTFVLHTLPNLPFLVCSLHESINFIPRVFFYHSCTRANLVAPEVW